MLKKLIELILSTDLSLSYGRSSDALNIAENLIANGVTIQKWIPVSERLPEVGKKVLVYCKENKNDYEIGAYSDTYRGFFVRQTWYENITHWMPMPEPPKEVQE